MQKSKKILLLWVVGCCLITGLSFADEVRLLNGDRLTGKIVSMQADDLTLQTSFAGEITIKWSEVARIRTETPLRLVLADETKLEGIPQSIEDRKIKLQLDSLSEPIFFDMDQVSAINPPEEPPVRLNGQLNFGFSKATGNTDTERIHGDGELVARTQKSRYTAGAEYNRAKDENEKTEDNVLGYLKYDHFLTPKFYFYMNGLFEKDEFKDINLRSTAGAGLGYQFFESEQMNLSVEAGPSYVNTDFDEGDDEDSVSGRWAVKFDRFFFDKLFQYYFKNEGYVSLTDANDVFMFTRTGLRFPLRMGLFLNGGWEWDWDNQPALGSDKSDYRYILSLGYGF
ncbi:MAG: DUF481 domain-containing protein [Desulfobacterales bacterium]|nr:MAG: DUF481 domain-containing protein [Desulfobacterales bacterium]